MKNVKSKWKTCLATLTTLFARAAAAVIIETRVLDIGIIPEISQSSRCKENLFMMSKT